MTRTHLDLFSGVGGFALASSWANFSTVQFVEIDAFCQQVLAKHFPGVPIHDDITTFSGGALAGRIDLLTGGFPCQSFSVAGKQRGADDDRHLWPEMVRVIDETRPRWVLGENVAGFIPMALDDCLTDLEGIGYEAWAVVVPACAVGAWHRRDRVWIVAHAGYGALDQRTRHSWRETGERTSERIEPASVREVTSDAERGRRWEPMRTDAVQGALPETIGAEGAPGTRSSGADAADDTGQPLDNANSRRYRAPGELIRAGWDGALDTDWWELESQFRGVPPGLSTGVDGRAARLKALGNAIVPQVAYEIIRLMEMEDD